jgi:hypothetical protein
MNLYDAITTFVCVLYKIFYFELNSFSFKSFSVGFCFSIFDITQRIICLATRFLLEKHSNHHIGLENWLNFSQKKISIVKKAAKKHFKI